AGYAGAACRWMSSLAQAEPTASATTARAATIHGRISGDRCRGSGSGGCCSGPGSGNWNSSLIEGLSIPESGTERPVPWPSGRRSATIQSHRLPMIQMFHVTKAYPGDPPALVDVNLTVEKGEFVFLTGPSGAGKTTLLR